ncbi:MULTISPECIES: TetR/AcrR family transcriptional regulator [unclassified Brevibacterium]|uniref:TetR/AcrR family transcriptional regulator n=1 Tax=unclassified Brevibacterium TaxID=2614124 RepID=UPI001092CB9B|nr:TetR/AcrR family transcriptional regulator [Brevibacterium sp. S22]TGD33230.1 TetR/AcrR family transcriptional regulator [Brevibacterium sp. S22]
MPKVTEEHRQAMRRRIQDAALACFARKGFTGASMAEIVKEADLSAGAVYVYYASKGDLMIDVARRVMEPRIAVLQTAQSEGEVTEPHVVFVELLDSLLVDNPFSSVLVQVWGEASYDEEFASFVGTIFEALLEEFTEYLASYLREQRGIEPESARAQAAALVPAILAMLQGAVVQATVFGDSSRQRVRAGIEGLLSRLAL